MKNSKTRENDADSLRQFVLSFYAARREGDLARVREMIDPFVRWIEPTWATTWVSSKA